MMNWIKNKVYKAGFKSVLFLGLLFCAGSVDAKLTYEKTKTVSTEFEVNSNSVVELVHDRGWVNVLYYDGAQAKLEANLVVKGNEKEDVEKLISKYTLEVNNQASKITVNSDFHIETWSSVTWFLGWGTHRVKFSDGEEIKTKIDIIKSDLTLWLPNVAELQLENEYNNIQIGDLSCDVAVSLFSGNLDVGNVDGDLNVELKYGNANIGNFKQANIDIFEGKLFLKNGETLGLKSKYSTIEAGHFNDLNLDVFEGKISLGAIKDELMLKGKYAEIKLESMDRGIWDLFECKVEIDKAVSLELKDQYGNHELKEVESLEVDAFETNFNIGTAGSIISNSDKYAEFKIDLLKSSFLTHASFEGKLNVRSLDTDFQGIDFSGKYGALELPLYQIDHYQLDFESTYGKVDYEESKMDISKLVNDGDSFALVGKSKDAATNSALVKVSGFEMSLSISQ